MHKNDVARNKSKQKQETEEGNKKLGEMLK